MSSLLHFQNVSKSYGAQKALQGISLEVQPGEIVAVLGSNGAGKTTLVNLASGLQRPESGRVTVLGQDPHADEVKKLRRTLPQELSFPSQLRVREIIELVGAHYPGCDMSILCDRLRLKNLFRRLASELSGGERRKLALACALAGNPQLVMLDEPTANVDLEGQELIRSLLLEYFASSERSLVFSSHQMQEVEVLAHRVVVLKQGQIVANAPVAELKKFIGLKKVRCRPSISLKGLSSIAHLEVFPDHVEAFGADSDKMLREILDFDKNAKNFEVVQPALDEVILRIFSQGRFE